MQKFRQICAEPRFTSSELVGWSPKDLRSLMISSSLIESSLAIKIFRRNHRIDQDLTGVEQAIIQQCITKQAQSGINSVVDVHSHYLKLSECIFAPAGMVVAAKQKMGPSKPFIVPATLWLTPVELSSPKPGIEWLVGMAITCLQRSEGALIPFYEAKAYQTLNFTSLEPEQLITFAHVLISYIGPFFTGKKNSGNGRAFIAELFAAFNQLSKVDYLLMHLAVCEGPLSRCFEWGLRTTGRNKNGKVVHGVQPIDARVPGKPQQVILSVKPKYVKSFFERSADT